jgi:hypothetical protein
MVKETFLVFGHVLMAKRFEDPYENVTIIPGHIRQRLLNMTPYLSMASAFANTLWKKIGR